MIAAQIEAVAEGDVFRGSGGGGQGGEDRGDDQMFPWH
jgi:hypothetical protein